MRHPEDQHNFIGSILRGIFEEPFVAGEDDALTREPGMVVHTTIQKRYTVDDFRRIIATPSHVLASYHLSFINDQVTVTIQVINTVAEV